jgi:cytochrome b subunit of formate dehydrogenase
MSDILKWIAPFAILAVAVVLVFGLINMMKGGNPNTSQKLMRWRVILQFIAVVILMLVLYVKSRT